MEIKIEAKAKLVMELSAKQPLPTLKYVDVDLEVHHPLKRHMYFDKDGLPNNDGLKTMVLGFIQGLSTTIKHGHRIGYKNEVEHLEFVINELKRSLGAISELDTGEY